MSDVGAAARYLAKAERTLRAARILLAEGDTEGACNRAYYAMFDAAQAGLRAAGVVAPDVAIKTHHGLLTLVGRELVQAGHLDADHGKALNQVQVIRLRADYTTDPPGLDDAVWAIERADAFVRAVWVRFSA